MRGSSLQPGRPAAGPGCPRMTLEYVAQLPNLSPSPDHTIYTRMTTIDEIVENFALLEEWDDRYRYVIELGRMLAPLPESAHIDANKVQGCASQVWLVTHVKPNGLLRADPDLRGRQRRAYRARADRHPVCALFRQERARHHRHRRRSRCSTVSACARTSRRNARTACAPWSSASAPKPTRRRRRSPDRLIARHTPQCHARACRGHPA